MKELIKTIVLVLLIVVAIYFAFVVTKVNDRMDNLNVADSVHVVNIDGFDHNLHDLDLRFIGRGKHIQQFQRDLKALDQELDITARKFDVKIDSVGLLISELRMNTEAELANLKRDHEETAKRLSQFQRKTNRTRTDLQTALSRLNREKNDLEKRVKTLETPPEDPKKKK
jgi:chromosome segregation ATPase